MKFYAVAELNITNPKWIPEYAEKVTKMVEDFGGKYLARTSEILCLEGDAEIPNISLLIEFPSKEIAESFYNSEEYQPFLKSRKSGSISKFFLVAGKDDTGQSTK